MSTDRALEAARRIVDRPAIYGWDAVDVATALLALSEEVERFKSELELARSMLNALGKAVSEADELDDPAIKTAMENTKFVLAMAPPSSQPGNSEEGSEQ